MTSHEEADLEKVLDYYDVRFSPNRLKQMVQCPFHEDRTPSLSLNLAKGLWRCHSCNQGGDAYTMIEKKEGVQFVGATAFATAQRLTTGSPRRGDEDVRESAFSSRRHVPGKSGSDRAKRRYVPAWRR